MSKFFRAQWITSTLLATLVLSFFVSPTYAGTSPSANSVSVKSVAGGKAQIKLDLADKYQGKTVTLILVRTTAGKKNSNFLGTVKLGKYAIATFPTYVKFLKDDTLRIYLGTVNIAETKIPLFLLNTFVTLNLSTPKERRL